MLPGPCYQEESFWRLLTAEIDELYSYVGEKGGQVGMGGCG
jgi:hypothetical protein